MKDNFSGQSIDYAKYRPTYPATLYEYLFSLVATKDSAWDCGTGNGQIASKLADQFKRVYATDISKNQLANAIQKENIMYSCTPAEHTDFEHNSFNLITVGQAIHWFNFEKFYKEVNRTIAKNKGIIAVIGYGLNAIEPAVDTITHWFYKELIGKYWDKERHYIDELYQTIPFPFAEIKTPSFESSFEWTLLEYLGYLSTWSAVQHYIKMEGESPIPVIKSKLSAIWKEEEYKTVRFPILLRVGKMR